MNGTPTLSYEALKHLPMEALRYLDNETIWNLVEDHATIEADRVASGRAMHGRWVKDAAEMAQFQARRVARMAAAGGLAVAALSANAMDAEETAQAAAVADGASTAAVLAAGAVESNPVVNAAGLPLITAAKFAIPYMVRDAEPATRKAVLVGASGIYGGAAVNNLLLLAGAGPVAIVGGIVAGIWFGLSAADKVDAEQVKVVAAAE